MELKSYQQQVITDLASFLEYLQKYPKPAMAFKQYWEDKVGPYELTLDKTYSGMVPYKENNYKYTAHCYKGANRRRENIYCLQRRTFYF